MRRARSHRCLSLVLALAAAAHADIQLSQGLSTASVQGEIPAHVVPTLMGAKSSASANCARNLSALLWRAFTIILARACEPGTECLPRSKAFFMFHPAVATVESMLKAYAQGADEVNVVSLIFPLQQVGLALERLTAGDVLIWFGRYGVKSVPWRVLHSKGVKTIYYRTEPQEPTCPPAGVDETWEYTYANMQPCTFRGKYALGKRYVPPGYTPPDSGHPPPLPPSTNLTFIGSVNANLGTRGPAFHHRRQRCFADLKRRLPPGELRFTSSAWTEEEYASIVEKSAIFLSFHKGCGLANQPLEAFRISKLLSYGRIVLAERSFSADERSFEGLLFSSSLDEMPRLYERLKRMGHSALRELAARQHNEFITRFSPTRLLYTSGVANMLDCHRGVAPLTSSANYAQATLPADNISDSPTPAAPSDHADILGSAIQRCLPRLWEPVARRMALQALNAHGERWTKVMSWHRPSDDAAARAVYGEIQPARCAVVASSPTLLQQLHGTQIDGHNLVMRFNFAPTAGYEAHVGSRTDFHMMAETFVPTNHSKHAVVLHRYYSPALKEEDLIANGNFSVVELTGRPLLRIGRGRRLWFPSSGIAGVVFLLKSCTNVSLYGFDLAGKAPGHYFDDSTEGHAAAMINLVAKEPWRLKLAPHSLRIPKGVLQVRTGLDASSGKQRLAVSEISKGAYKRFIERDYEKLYAKNAQHNLKLERNTLLAFIAAGCVQHQ